MDNRLVELENANQNYDGAREVLQQKYQEAAEIYDAIIYQFSSAVTGKEEADQIFNQAMDDNNIDAENWQIYNDLMADNGRTLGAIERLLGQYLLKWNEILNSYYTVYVRSERIDNLQRSLIDRIRQRQQQHIIRAIPRAAPAA